MKRIILLAFLGAVAHSATATDLKTPADMSAESQEKMYSLITDYNRCMMENRLQTSQQGEDSKKVADNILQSCENHLDDLKLHLAANDIDHALTDGMVKKLRSRAARQLMTKTMNNLAAQANAMSNADKVQQ